MTYNRYVNYVGAFVFVATRKVDTTLIVVEAMDNVGVLVAEHGRVPESAEAPSDKTLWNYFRKAANDATVGIILDSARLVE
jgi:hypothetical protein